MPKQILRWSTYLHYPQHANAFICAYTTCPLTECCSGVHSIAQSKYGWYGYNYYEVWLAYPHNEEDKRPNLSQSNDKQYSDIAGHASHALKPPRVFDTPQMMTAIPTNSTLTHSVMYICIESRACDKRKTNQTLWIFGTLNCNLT